MVKVDETVQRSSLWRDESGILPGADGIKFSAPVAPVKAIPSGVPRKRLPGRARLRRAMLGPLPQRQVKGLVGRAAARPCFAAGRKRGDMATTRHYSRQMRALFLALLLLVPSVAFAQLQAQPRTVSPTAVTITLTATENIQVTMIGATLIDGAGRSYDMSGWPRGISAGIQSSCKINSNLTAGSSLIVSIPFNAQGSSPPYALTMQFETRTALNQLPVMIRSRGWVTAGCAALKVGDLGIPSGSVGSI
jgi:hypothetical protein